MEEDYKLFKLIKENPINSCMDLSKNMRGKKNGVFYFTEKFRIDFENKMIELGRLEEENKNLKQKLHRVCKEANKVEWETHSMIPVSLVEEKLEELKEKGESDLKTYGFAVETHLAKQVLEELLEGK